MPNELGDLVRFCPNLEQLGLATNAANHNTLRLLIPFLPKLKAIRLLANESLNEHLRVAPDEKRMAGMSVDLWRTGVNALKWVGVGDFIYRAGESYTVTKDDGSTQGRRKVTKASLNDVKDIELWRMDSLDIDVDPVAPFDP